MRGVFLDLNTVDRGDLDLEPLQSSVSEWTSHAGTAPEDVVERIRDADIIVSNKVRLDRNTLQSAARLKLACIAATGTNNIDLGAARDLKVTVCNVTAYATPSVVEHVFALMLTLARRLFDYRDAVDQGRWQKADEFCLLDFPITELAGLTLGIIGYGELGRGVAALGKAFGMQVLIAERPDSPARPGRTPFTQVLEQSHVITLHCPLNDNTHHLIGAPELGMMRHDALLLNTARGGIVDETALRHALQSGLIAGAGVDVLTGEPPRNGNPLLDAALPNLVVTPHIAWASRSARQRLVNEITGNIRAWLGGTPRNVVQD